MLLDQGGVYGVHEEIMEFWPISLYSAAFYFGGKRGCIQYKGRLWKTKL